MSTSAEDIDRRLHALPGLTHAQLEARVAARSTAAFAHAASRAEPHAMAAGPALSFGLVATVLAYVGWAIDFAIALCR